MKSRSFILTVLLFFVTATGSILTIIGASGFFDDLGLPLLLRKILSYSGAATMLVAAALFVIYLYRILRTGTYFSDVMLYRNTFYTEICDADGVEKIVDAAEIIFNDATDDSETRRIKSFDDQAFTVIRDNKKRFRGYYCVLRLSKDGKDAIHDGSFSVKTVSPKFLRTDSKKKYNDLYIGAIYADGAFSKHFVLGSIFDYVSRNKPRSVYARAATSDGIRLLNKYNFKPLFFNKPGLGEFYVRHS
ncbi:hypothetical protein [Rhizobium sp. PAMB 3182]